MPLRKVHRVGYPFAGHIGLTMQVHELIQKLQRFPPDAVVVVDGDVVHDVEVRDGELLTGYFNAVFRFVPHGKVKAVVFMANTELSTGEVVSTPK